MTGTPSAIGTLSLAAWRKSTASASTGCVEVCFRGGSVLVRDSKDPGGPMLSFNHHEWLAFLQGVAQGEFDLPRLDQEESELCDG